MSQLPPLAPDFAKNHDLAWTLPKEYYTSDEAFSIEKEEIFAKSWLCVAHISELDEPHDYVTREIIGESIIVIRGRDNVLRAFYNVCPHRGHRILEGRGKAKNVLTCPYHAWSFKLDGSLAGARNCNNVQNFDKELATLVPVKVEEYAGFVFINMDPNAGCVEDQVPGLAAAMQVACPVIKDLQVVHRKLTRLPANWKVIVDNYQECYHCQPAHHGFVDSVQMDTYRHTLHQRWTLQSGQATSSSSSYHVDPTVENPSFEGFWTWPAVMFSVPPGGDYMSVIYSYPISAEETEHCYELYFLNAADQLTAEQQAVVDYACNTLQKEDMSLVINVQKGLNSRGYRGQGRFMVDAERSGISEHGVAYFAHLVAQVHQARAR